MRIRKSVCVRGGVWRAGGASDEQALQTQWFTASSDICLSLCLSGPHGRVAWRVAWSRGVAWHGVWRVAWRGSAAAVQPHLEGCSGGLGDSGIWLRNAPAEEGWEVITSEVRDG